MSALAVSRLNVMDRLLEGERERRRPPEFINEQQRTFFESTAPEVLYSGAFRAGKSRIGCEKAWYLARRYPGIPIGIFRKVKASIYASTERTLLHDVIPRVAITASNRSESWYELANGSRIWFFGLDPDPITGIPSKVGSVELGWAFIDEATELTQDDWGMVKGRLSWPGIPYHQVAAATNPAGPMHWLKRRFTPPTPERVYLHASTFDNPALPADYLSEAAGAADDYRHRRYHLGEWVGAEGMIWELPDAAVRFPDPGIVWKRTVAGLDWGFVHAFACEVIGQTGSGAAAVRAEIYERGKTLDDLIPRLLSLQVQFGIEAFYGDPSEPQNILTLQRAGLNVLPATNDVLPGISAVTDAITRGLTVAPTCSGLLGELPAYTWISDRNGQQERPVKVGDDACDALRYGVMALATNTWGSYGSGNA